MTSNDFEELLFVLVLDIPGIVALSKQTNEMIKYVVSSPSHTCVRN